MIAQNGFMIAHKSIYVNILNTVELTYIYKMAMDKRERVLLLIPKILKKWGVYDRSEESCDRS